MNCKVVTCVHFIEWCNARCWFRFSFWIFCTQVGKGFGKISKLLINSIPKTLNTLVYVKGSKVAYWVFLDTLNRASWYIYMCVCVCEREKERERERENDQPDVQFFSLIYSNYTILYMFRKNISSSSAYSILRALNRCPAANAMWLESHRVSGWTLTNSWQISVWGVYRNKLLMMNNYFFFS